MEGSNGALWGLFYKGTNLIHEGSAFKPKSPLPNTITTGD